MEIRIGYVASMLGRLKGGDHCSLYSLVVPPHIGLEYLYEEISAQDDVGTGGTRARLRDRCRWQYAALSPSISLLHMYQHLFGFVDHVVVDRQGNPLRGKGLCQ